MQYEISTIMQLEGELMGLLDQLHFHSEQKSCSSCLSFPCQDYADLIEQILHHTLELKYQVQIHRQEISHCLRDNRNIDKLPIPVLND